MGLGLGGGGGGEVVRDLDGGEGGDVAGEEAGVGVC